MIIEHSSYTPTVLFRNSHINTAYRTLFLNYTSDYQRIRINTIDSDFLDLDFLFTGSDSIAIMIHGLEGSSDSSYVKSTSLVMNRQGIDTVIINLRGCSGEENKTLGSYHSGKTDDLERVISYILNIYSYKNIYLTGFSLGGNQILKYLGEKGSSAPPEIKAAVAVSVPTDLEGSALSLSKTSNKLYMERFLKSLKQKTLIKLEKFKDAPVDKDKMLRTRNFYDFDNVVTAPVFGFKDAVDYWKKNSSKAFIPEIKVDTLLLTAKDDPFLSASCFPVDEARDHPHFFLEMNPHGGHVGFNVSIKKENNNWMENRIIGFLKNH